MKFFIFGLLGFMALSVNAQGAFHSDYLIWVEFSDKAESTFDLHQSDQFLSARSINRRRKYQIAIDSTDLPVDQAKINRVQQLMANARLVGKSKWMNATLWATAQINDTLGLMQISGVSSYAIQKFPETVPPTVSNRSLVAPSFEVAQAQLDLINYPPFYALGFDGTEVLIGITDSGFEWVNWAPVFDYSRPRISFAYNVMKGNDSVYVNGFHGSYVLQCIAGERSSGVLGTASGAHYALINTENPAYEYLGEESQWIIGAEYADSIGVDVLNVSLGYTTFDTSIFNHSINDLDGKTALISRGAQMAADKGIAVVCSAGNSGTKAWKKLGCPSDAAGVFTIGACNAEGVIAPFSSYGPSADGRVKPDVTAVGWDMIVQGLSDHNDVISGTSFSGPTMAGVIACFIQAFPQKSHQEIYQALRTSAHLYNTPENQFGYGIPDIYRAYRILSGTLRQDLIVYPNPSKDGLIALTHPNFLSWKTIKVFEEGRVVYQKNTVPGYRVILNLSALSAGMYFLQAEDANGEVFKSKIVLE